MLSQPRFPRSPFQDSFRLSHSDIETTLRYVQVTPQDVYLQYARAVAQCIRPLPRSSS